MTEPKTEEEQRQAEEAPAASSIEETEAKEEAATVAKGDQGEIELELDEMERLLLEAKESRLKAAKQAIISQIDKQFDLQKQNAIQQALKNSPEVCAAENMLDVATNRVLDNVSDRIPDDYCVTNLSWENGKLTAAYAPGQKGKRRPV